MNRRRFLSTSAALAGGVALSRTTACARSSKPVAGTPLTNWAGNLRYSTANVQYPNSVEEVQQIVRSADKLRALGTRHSFNTIADSNRLQLSTRALNKIVSLDRSANTVTVEGGIKYGELCGYLQQNGYALRNLASLPHISIGGAVATATHGSGVKNGNLATQVSAIEFVDAAGNVVQLSRAKNAEQFQGAVVGLGALGVVTKLTLDLEPTFDVQQVVYLDMPMRVLEHDFESIMSSGYSVSFFTTWANKTINEVWIKSRVNTGAPTASPAPEFHGARLATRNMHPVAEQSAESTTPQMGVTGAWCDRLPHFKMGFTPSTGAELQAEYFVPIDRAYEAMMAIETLHEQMTPHLFISEIRTIAADDLWMSPNYHKASVSFHTTFKPEWDAVMRLLPQIEERLSPFNAVPHWAKLFTMAPAVLQSRHPRIADFRRLVDRYDPAGKFRNDFVSRNIYGG